MATSLTRGDLGDGDGPTGVVIPARDEEASIGSCLDSLRMAAAHLGDAPSVTVVVVLDTCFDRTAEVAATAGESWQRCPDAPRLILMPARCANVGAARALGFDMLRRLDERWQWLATTDADSAVPQNWLAHQLALRAAGADAWLGTVTVTDVGPSDPHGALTDLGGLAAHPHVHGANLGLSLEAYVGCGGFAPLSTGEDVDLARRLLEGGWRVVSGGGAPVLTSGRLVGRAPSGFAADRAAGLPLPAVRPITPVP